MRVFVPSVIFSTTVLLLLGGISYASEENVNAMVSSESNQQLPGNAPPDADKRRSAQNAKETMLRGESSGTGNVTLEELKALMEMGIDELVVRDEEIADGDIANASDDTEGSNGVDYSKDGASSHKQEVNHQPKSASAVVANAAKIQQQGEEEYDEEDEFDESVYEQELAKFLADQNFVDETRDLDEEDMDGGLNNGTEATSRRHLRYLHSKKIELPSIYIHGNDKHNEDNKNNNETRRLQNLSTSTIGTFAPLSCNLPSLPTTSQCHKTPTGLFSTLVNAANGAPITIPCGTCYKYDLPWGRTFELGGLDIIGKLYIPPNWKTVIKTPYIFVQGELEIINNRLITPDNLSTRIILTGESDVWFRPADSNQGVEGTPFNAGKKPLLVAGGKLNIRGWDRDDTSSTLSDEASYTTWSPILSKTADGTFALRDDETGISSRWGPMSEIHITSSTLSSLDGHDAVLSTISPNADGITASITLQTPVDTTTTPITSEEESPGRGAEVTLLSRNIVIEGEFLSTDTYPTQSGGYLQILHTPGVSQIIEGVDFQNMGQELGKNRFPIQFLYNGDVLGSSVARNTIRNSNHRCIVVEGTSNVTVASNVAYETAGHCYFFGHESVDNIVRGNIGVRTNDVIGSGSQLDGHSDHSRATFFLWSPINEYIGNVAAGGDGRGFYMYNNAKTLGEDLVSTSNGNLRRVAMKTFKDNKSHSNVWQGFVFYNFEQYYTFYDDINIPLFENTMAYRNQQHGILGNNLHGAMFRGGILADNQWGMRIPRSDGIKIEDFRIMGYTDVVGDVTASNDKIKLCARSSWNLQGIIMMNTRWMYGEHVLGYGMRMKNVTFSDFDKNTGSCASSWPIAMDSYKYYDTHFDYLSSWENVRVVDSRGYVLDGCGAMQTNGFNDVVINDLNGSLDRTGLSTGPSALVSNTPALTKLLGNKCSAHTDSCMAYCSGVCMQSFYYNVEQFRSETWKLVITDANGESTEISGSIEAVDDYSFSDAFRYTKFPVALPAGTYTAHFVDELGDLVWPTFVEEVWEEPPACAGSAKPEDIKFVKPEISDDCDDLFRLEDTGTTNPWIHTDTGVEVAIGMGISGTDAIRTSNRRYSWTGFGQNIDTRCIDLRPNQYYEFAALIKLTDTSGSPALDTAIDPNVQWDLNKSPIMTLSAREYRDAATKKFIYTTEDRDKAWMARPYKPNDWNLVHGIFRLPENCARVFWEIERAPELIQFIVDSVSITPFTCSPDMLVKNGDLEHGDTTIYWDTWGGGTGLEIVPGYGGSGNALKAFQRLHQSDGPAQEINIDCLHAGDRLGFQARIKFEADGSTSFCNPNTWDSNERCSDFFIYTYKQGIKTYERVAWIVTDDTSDGWYFMSGVSSLSSDQAKADYSKIYFDGANAAFDVVVDDVQVKHLVQNCKELVLNPSFESNTAYWSFIDRSNSKIGLYSPGAGGESDFALRSYDRGSGEWRGVRQQLDVRCFVPGIEYTISAKFRLLNAVTQVGETCDTNALQDNKEETQCPTVVIFGWGCDGGDVYLRHWNQVSFFEWDANNFNDFESSFLVTDKLASCDTVHVYIHQINRNWDIVIDDVRIFTGQEESPTYSPTQFPSIDIGLTTEPPTLPPTSRPTVATVTNCPDDELSPIEISAGPIMLSTSSSLCILTKAMIDANGLMSNIAPVARSYDGMKWEKAAGQIASMLLYKQEFGHFDNGSQITLPELDGGAKYFLTSYSYSLNDENSVARLLESATFGTTQRDIASWNKGPVTNETVAQWIQEQMEKPLTSHREYFRRRVNPRFSDTEAIGRSDHPCRGLSRWRKFTFAKTDGDTWWRQQYFIAEFTSGDKYIAIKLNGHLRTVVKKISFKNKAYTLEFNREYKMCRRPEEAVRGVFFVYVDDGSCQEIRNPSVAFYPDSVQPTRVLKLPALAQNSIGSIDEHRSNGGEFILFEGLGEALCSTLNEVTEGDDAPIFGKFPDNSWLVYDPRLILEENSYFSHLQDGGGIVQTLTGGNTRCSNVPRTFLNEDKCTLSFLPLACSSAVTPDIEIELNAENIAYFHTTTDQYVYSILGLPVVDSQNDSLESPCTVGLRSRWEIRDAIECAHSPLDEKTNATLVELLVMSSDTNQFVRDIIFPTKGYSCSADDTLSLGNVELIIGNRCYKRVHPDHMSVYDFTKWSLEDTHPGNMVAAMDGRPNPITKWMDLYSSVFLTYPSFSTSSAPSHPVTRWVNHSHKFPFLGRFGDTIKFVDLPNELRLDEVAHHFGHLDSHGGEGVVVCGSPYEASNVPVEGYQFDVYTGHDADLAGAGSQRESLWTMVGLQAEDQLRQRIAWALAQVIVVVTDAVRVHERYTEAFLSFYDIFVRHAFGNYGDIMREISYNPLMAENLSFLQSKSAAYMWETQGKISFADENFAREIMQLFSTGLYLLNLDGTLKLDDNNLPIPVYSNDEIMSFSRVWTGFDYQQKRGNVEESWATGNRHDPMKIEAAWRDKFPKSDLIGGYIGDGYPLCVDLPQQMFLRKGATYRLLGTSSTPELMEDHHDFKKDSTVRRLVLDANSPLQTKLCNAVNGSCQYLMSVTLDENIACTEELKECKADTLRVVDVGDGVYYEYVRPPCVEQAFFNNAKKVIYRERLSDASCANPLLPYASEACCSPADFRGERYPNYLYDQERVLFSTAQSRCAEVGKQTCDFIEMIGLEPHKLGYHWTPDDCHLMMKVNTVGHVAIVYEPEDYSYLHPHIRDDNRNYFKVYWKGDYPRNDEDILLGNNCGNGACESLVTGGCLCRSAVSESRVFSRMPRSANEVLSYLNIGAYDPSAFDEGTMEQEENGVKAYLAFDGKFDKNTVFEVVDEFGRKHRLKNSQETVRVQGAPEYSFRNAPSFMSLLNTEADVRDAQYETQAALDHYLYHPNTAPFIAVRLIQRFTTSNPNPRYVKEVATAFQRGKYSTFGTGAYGDLAATMAAVLLDPEARSVVLDSDPYHGSVREPILKVMSLMRNMDFQKSEAYPVMVFDGMVEKVGQMAWNFPSVFSFFLPEYVPDGKPGQATLVSPEAKVMDMPKMVGILNGMFSLVKYGLSNCNGGFGIVGNCREGEYRDAAGHLSLSIPYSESSDNDQAEMVVNKLSTLLTSGRLSNSSKDVIKNAYMEQLPDTSAALRMAQQLILTSPEFHTTNTVKMNGSLRNKSELPQSTGTPYRAIVYVMFGGGCDSFNMLVPHTCGTKDLYEEYVRIREEISLPKESLLEIDATSSNQICESFGLHPRLDAVQSMYNDGDLLFFANTGVLTKETDKANWWADTKSHLFAHNWMQLEAERVDPLKERDGTGVLGRIADALNKQGRSVGTFSIERNSISVVGTAGLTPAPSIISRFGVDKFNEGVSSETMNSIIAALNGATTPESGVFGDLWSETLVESLSHNELLHNILSSQADTTTLFPESYVGRQLNIVAKMIDSRVERGVDADMFFVSAGGWDTHADVLERTDELFNNVDDSFKAFADEMKLKGVWGNVTVIQTSDFGRTLAPNSGRGSDHAWGGNYMMFGGGVMGKQIVGTYPKNLTEEGERSLGRGRMIPTTSWDAVFLPLARWAGATSDDFPNICPNMDNLPATHFIDATNLFELIQN